MGKNTKFGILAALLIVIMVLATILYPKLSQKYEEDNAASAGGYESKIQAPDFTVYDVGGNAVSLSDMAGKPVIVNFWATWCKYCVEELPFFDRYAEEYGDEICFMMVDLPDGSRETVEKALAFAENEGYDFPVYFDSDGSASYTYQVRGIPMTLLIDSEGNLYKIHSGLMDEETLKKYIEALTK